MLGYFGTVPSYVHHHSSEVAVKSLQFSQIICIHLSDWKIVSFWTLETVYSC